MRQRQTKRWFFIFTLVLSLMGCSDVESASESESMKLHLNGSTYAEFIDFLYDFSASNRLNVQWFGWYRVDNAQHWYERSDKASTFKINIHLLTEKNGYLYFSNGFDEKSVNFIIDYGEDKKPVWLEVVEKFKKELEAKGWVTR